jgi:single-stranded DNA-binding protein
MKYNNHIQLEGILGRDLRITIRGEQTIIALQLSTHEAYTELDKPTTPYIMKHEILMYRELPARLMQSLKKGDKLQVKGVLYYYPLKDNTGKPNAKAVIIAHSIKKLS